MNPHIFYQNGAKPIYPFCVTHRYSLHKTLPREASSSLDNTHPGTFARICECRIFSVLLLTDILFNFFYYSCYIEDVFHGLKRMNDPSASSANRSQSEKAVEAFFLGVLFVVAFLSNGTICCAMLHPYRLKTPSNLFPFSLAVASLSLTLLHTPFALASVVLDKWPFNHGWCQASGMLINLISMASNFSIVTIALHRYYLVVKPLSVTINIYRARAMVAFVWFTSLVTAIPPVFGWNSYRYISGKAFCAVDWEDGGPSLVYSLYIVAVSFLAPFGILVYIYRSIYLKTKRQRIITDYNTLQGLGSEYISDYPPQNSQNIYQKVVTWFKPNRRRSSQYSVSTPTSSGRGNLSSPGTSTSFSFESSATTEKLKEREIRRRREAVKQTLFRQSTVYEQKTVQSAFILLISFLVNLSPYYIVGLWAGFSQRTPSMLLDFIVSWIFVSMTAVNPILYGFWNRQIRRVVWKSTIGQLVCHACKFCNVESGTRGFYSVSGKERTNDGLESDR